LTKLESSVFKGCSSLVSVSGKSISVLGVDCFRDCSSLETVSFPNITEISWWAFGDCNSLETIGVISANTIDMHAFQGCFNLSEIRMTNAVKSVSSNAFADCSYNMTVYFEGTESDWNNITIDDGNDPLKYADVVFILPVTGVSFSRKDVTVDIKGTEKLNVIFSPAGSSTELVYESNNPEVVSVDNDGNVTGLAEGSATITVQTANRKYKDTCRVTVRIIPVTSISLSVTEKEILKGETIQASAVLTPSNASLKTVKWSTSDNSIAEVDENGLITGTGSGKATITGTAHNGKKASVTIMVRVPVTGFSVEESAIDLSLNNTYSLNYSFEPADATNRIITWKTSDRSVATVKNGVVTAVGLGIAVITGKTSDGGYTAQTTVTTYYQPLNGLSFDSDNAVVVFGETKQMPCIWNPENASNKNAEWRSDHPEIVQIDEKGNITGMKVGTANIKALTEEGGYEADTAIRVQFRDVTNPEEFYYDYVYDMTDNDIVAGWADGTFRPYNNCNRAAVVTFLWRMAGRPEPSSIASFSDMTGNDDFDKAISWASETGITTGWADGTFRPWNTCNRAAIMTFLWRFAGSPETELSDSFVDMTGNEDFDNAILWGVENGITTGWADGTFRPWNNCTRLAIVSFLSRYHQEYYSR